MSVTYEFHPMTDNDLPLVKHWLNEPHVREWWHDPVEQFERVSGHAIDPDITQFIVSSDKRPFAYLQCYRLSDWHVGLGTQPQETRGLDQFIGETDMMGRGHGSAFVRQFVNKLFVDGAPRVVIDPDPNNARAIRAYEKAGFQRDRVVRTPDGPALLMVRDK